MASAGEIRKLDAALGHAGRRGSNRGVSRIARGFIHHWPNRAGQRRLSLRSGSFMSTATPERICFVTGRLAEAALRPVVERLASDFGFAGEVAVLPITVAALMSPTWIAKHLNLPAGTIRLLVPGYCEGELTPLTEKFPGVTIERG